MGLTHHKRQSRGPQAVEQETLPLTLCSEPRVDIVLVLDLYLLLINNLLLEPAVNQL